MLCFLAGSARSINAPTVLRRAAHPCRTARVGHTRRTKTRCPPDAHGRYQWSITPQSRAHHLAIRRKQEGAGPGQPGLQRSCQGSAVGRRHHLRAYPCGLPLSLGGHRRLQPSRRRLVHGQPPAKRTGHRRPRHGPWNAQTPRGDPPQRPGIAVHLGGLRQKMQTGRGQTLNGFGRRLLRQRAVRELLRQPGMRTARSQALYHQGRRQTRPVPIHRGLLQHPEKTLFPWIPLTHELRKEVQENCLNPKP